MTAAILLQRIESQDPSGDCVAGVALPERVEEDEFDGRGFRAATKEGDAQ